MPKPQRTCVACRCKRDQDTFLRLAREPSGEVHVWTGTGRSAYVCRSADCVAAAFQKGRLERALRARLTEERRNGLRKELECKLR